MRRRHHRLSSAPPALSLHLRFESPKQSQVLRLPLFAILVATVVLSAVLALRLSARLDASEQAFDSLLARADSISLAVLLSSETELGSSTQGGPTQGAGLRLGEALIRWQVGRRVALNEQERKVLRGNLLAWLGTSRLRGAALAFSQSVAMVGTGGIGGSSNRFEKVSPEPDSRTLSSLQRSFPDETVDAGRWLALLRLWPPEQSAELERKFRTTAFSSLDGAGLLRNFDGRMAELLSAEVLSEGELVELQGLATALLLQTR